MPSISGFWDRGPHAPIPVEPTWQEFVRTVGGQVITDLLPHPPKFENADFLFAEHGVIAELKEVETEFSRSTAFCTGFSNLMQRLLTEDPDWKPVLFGGDGNHPAWFNAEFLRLLRPPVSRILKKANRQIRETKSHFEIDSTNGVLFFVNDGLTSISPQWVLGLAANLLMHSFSSIDCFVYLTVNRYVEIRGSDVPRLMWAPTYSDRAPDDLVKFVDNLGRQWFSFIEAKIGPFTIPLEQTDDSSILRDSKSIVLPGENRG